MDIQFILKELVAGGLTDTDIAGKISTDNDRVAPSIVNRWRNGIHKKTSYDRYLRIKELYEQVTCQQ